MRNWCLDSKRPKASDLSNTDPKQSAPDEQALASSTGADVFSALELKTGFQKEPIGPLPLGVKAQ